MILNRVKQLIRLSVVLLLSLPAACAGLPFLEGTPAAQETPAPTGISGTAAPTLQVTRTPLGPPDTEGPVTLVIWLPPQFAPTTGTPGGDLLKARLDEFSARRPGARVEVRVKAADGPGGLLDSLTTTSAAAPLALPDLVALPRPVLEAAALKGLLHPLDGLTTALDNPDWYDYARQLGHLQNSTYGLPFAGDALALVYRSSVIETPPLDWAAVSTSSGPLAFSAADPQALFTLALYQAAGGPIRDEEGRPFLNVDILAKVFTFYREAEQAGVLPFWLTQYQSEDQVMDALGENQANMAATWTSRYLSETLTGTALAPIPTPDGKPFTLATGWVWALATPRTQRQELSVQLAEFLTESSFLTGWLEAAAYLPPRPSALEAFPDPSLQATLNQIVLSAVLYPPPDVLTSLGPALQRAVVEVLKQETDPLTAAQEAAAGLSGP